MATPSNAQPTTEGPRWIRCFGHVTFSWCHQGWPSNYELWGGQVGCCTRACPKGLARCKTVCKKRCLQDGSSSGDSGLEEDQDFFSPVVVPSAASEQAPLAEQRGDRPGSSSDPHAQLFSPPPSQPAQAPGCFPLPAPPPPPPSVGGGSIAGSRADRADAVVVVEWGEKGRISFYNKGARFEAVCFKHGPGCCKLTRTGAAPKGSRSLSRLAQGRPAGLLAAWLDSADNSNIARAADHKNPFWIAGVSRAQRSAARGKLKGMPFGLDLLSCERAQREEEMSEPEDVP